MATDDQTPLSELLYSFYLGCLIDGWPHPSYLRPQALPSFSRSCAA